MKAYTPNTNEQVADEGRQPYSVKAILDATLDTLGREIYEYQVGQGVDNLC
jgi:hypothetical protein